MSLSTCTGQAEPGALRTDMVWRAGKHDGDARVFFCVGKPVNASPCAPLSASAVDHSRLSTISLARDQCSGGTMRKMFL